MATYERGLCPFCKNEVKPSIVAEKNTIRRDVLYCPLCHEKILPCRTPGCNNYAESGKIYDEEFCLECTNTAGKVASVAGGIGGALLSIFTKKKWPPNI